ncbi:methyltransferase domain-containing protein [Uliginosibacterium sp. 31-16]|uniref:class I SAM-dependent methyltransferase n=1 Tax=Uliginosibacterium sp. 31-16 TaxID=3068315 RepID=UPI00273ED0B7|nr:class I SAM-dependent methyltransferase [Uliginosibacterium sp. 31-16]MDP5240689.1 methyltransferase domain-containing protein [Uliginosibacterium sp. 31-16]
MSDRILDFWNTQAEKFGATHQASWGDIHAIRLETENIGSFIKEGDRILDIGCANGFSAIQHEGKTFDSLTGVDFSEAMIDAAEKNRLASITPERYRFEAGDIRKLRFENESFDLVYTTRTLINLPSWDEQKIGISECLRVCRKGGTVILSEAFWEPLVLLNAMRTLKSLPPLVEHDFNRYLKKSALETFLGSLNQTFKVIDFSSIYYLGSRFIRELVTNPDDYPGYSNPINEIFYNIEKDYSGGGFGIQQAYVLTKN